MNLPCKACNEGMMLLVITTRRYMTDNYPFPVVVSYYKCSNPKCKATIGAEHRKNFFCKYCGMLTDSRAQVCGSCRRRGVNHG